MSAKAGCKSGIIRPSSYAWFVWGCAAAFYFYQFVLRVSPGIMSQELMRDFSVQGCSLGILGAFYYNAYAIMQIPLGMLLDKFGARLLLTISCAIAAIGTFVFSQAPDLAWASIGRMLMGAGAACGFIGALKLATVWFPINRVGRIVGFTMVLGTAGATFAGAPLGALIDLSGWRDTLMIVGIAGGILALLIVLIVRDKNPDIPIEEEPLNVEGDGIFKGLVVVLYSRQAWLVGLFGCMMYVPLAALADLWGTPYLSERFGIDRKLAATMISAIYIGVAVGAPITMMISDYLRRRKVVMLASAVCYLLALSSVLYIHAIPMQLMYVLMFMVGICFTGQCLVFAIITESMPRQISGVSLGFINTIVMLSGVVFEPLVGWLLDYRWGGTSIEGIPHFTLADFTFALSPIPIAVAIAVIVVMFVKESYPHIKGS